MEKYIVKIKLLSESIFGSGESQNNGVDIEILKDEIGVPYLKGKTFKGKLREEAEILKDYLPHEKKHIYNKIFKDLFGMEGEFDIDTLKFSNCTIAPSVWQNLKYGVENGLFSKEDVNNSLTEIRSFTKIDEAGIAKKGSLRQARVIKRDLVLYCNVECMEEISDLEKGFFVAALCSLRNLGTMESRGKGHVECRLFKGDKDITDEYINLFEREV